jgi:hypothetical protein
MKKKLAGSRNCHSEPASSLATISDDLTLQFASRSVISGDDRRLHLLAAA